MRAGSSALPVSSTRSVDKRRFIGIAWREDGIAGLEAEGVPPGALVPQRAGEGASSIAEVKR